MPCRAALCCSVHLLAVYTKPHPRLRRYNYREIVLASECGYAEWVSQRWDYAFFRRIDFNRRVK